MCCAFTLISFSPSSPSAIATFPRNSRSPANSLSHAEICYSLSTRKPMADISGGPYSSFWLQNNDYSSANTTPSPSYSSSTPTTLWTRHQDKIFEHALVMVPEHSPNRWLTISSLIPGKSAAEVRDHYDALVWDLLKIDSGRVELPIYVDDSAVSTPERESTHEVSEKTSKSRSSNEAERKKGKPWTRKEHQLFLLGLKTFGKGDWRSISRNMVITKTPTQVASHAQKYFLRHESTKKDRKRSSIHDITTVDGHLVAAAATDQSQHCQLITTTVPIIQPPPLLLPPQQFASASYFPDQRSLLEY